MIDNERTQRLLNVLQEGDRERRTTPASVDALLDAMIAVYDDCRTYAPSGDKPQSVVRFLQRCRAAAMAMH